MTKTEAGTQTLYQPRIDMVDALRGFALFGLFIVHVSEYFEMYWFAPPASDPFHDWVFGLFSGKAFALFALLFGFSFFIIMDRASKRGVDFTARFVWRLVLLAGIGWLHGLVYRGDVLMVLAAAGLVLIPFQRVKSNAVLVTVAALVLLQIPLIWQMVAAVRGEAWANANPHYYDPTDLHIYAAKGLGDVLRDNLINGQVSKWWFYIESGRLSQIIGLFLIGLCLGRIGFFAEPERFKKARWIALVVAAIVWIALFKTQGLLVAKVPADHGNMSHVEAGAILGGWADLSLMAVWLLGFIALYRAVPWLLGWLAPMGRMTLTLYVTQSLICVPLYYHFGLGWFATITQPQALMLGASVFAAQAVFANLWFRAFYYGPLEWLWRALTYLSAKVPFVRKAASAEA